MIKAIDEMLKLWAEEMHAPGSNGGGYAGGNLIAMLIASKGEVVRGHRGSRVILDRVAEVDRLVNRLPEELKNVVVEHYLNRDSFPEQKYRHCGCSRNTFYLRLHVAHQGIQDGPAAAGGLSSWTGYRVPPGIFQPAFGPFFMPVAHGGGESHAQQRTLHGRGGFGLA